MKSRIEKWYKQGLWSETLVQNAVAKGAITDDEYEKITGKGVPVNDE